MKVGFILSAASIVGAFVVPNQQQLQTLRETSSHVAPKISEKVLGLGDILTKANDLGSYVVGMIKNVERIADQHYQGAKSGEILVATDKDEYAKSLDDDDDPWFEPDGHHHHGKPNKTIYQLIGDAPHTTIFAKLVSQFDDIVDCLNSTSSNHTLFVPVDDAFKKFKHHPHLPKDMLKDFVLYHIAPGLYSPHHVFGSRTIPTELNQSELGPYHQRISTHLGLRGFTLNFYAHIVKGNIPATNGLINSLDNILFPPPRTSDTLDFLSSRFSTFELGLLKTGLFDTINDTSTHTGATVFAPTNFAFKKLGPKLTAFLFSRWGEKYLKALLEYHIVFNHTLYSDAYNKPTEKDDVVEDNADRNVHIDLPTLLEGHHLSVDIAHISRFLTIKINGFTPVSVPDIIVKDGVIHVLNDILIPPKKARGRKPDSDDDNNDRFVHMPFFGNADEAPALTVDELIERLEPYI
ncbi:hypothetical protein AJ80_01865 [Polytolypa hystricis UAMH7299]|uniref:FAS1 domain-containing protein n=1 Tax=Polytolypa hystricis (strain UAMH7299) TaxID=1447883 RepID=A0A2B7YZR8_POLH7|nr:hypothetical protein AJ80_01865 [Polytolypa hystricis UAMH7299]